jgi:large conductance mechanosensitive channel
MFKEFKEFAIKGSLVDIAIGITIGAAFGAVAASFVSDVFTPPLGLILGGVDFANSFVVLKQGANLGAYSSLAAAKADGAVTLNYGLFINTAINFLIVAFVMFIIIKAVNRLKKAEVAAPAPPAGPTADQKLLTEIRDLLKRT